MGIHGDKSQQERDWVLNGKYFKWKVPHHHQNLNSILVSYFRVCV